MDTHCVLVAGNSKPSMVAGAIANLVRLHEHVEVQAIGANAVNQMLKATIIACRYLQAEPTELHIVPSFAEVSIEGEERTAIRLYVQRCKPTCLNGEER